MEDEVTLGLLLALAGQCFAGDVAPATRDEHCFAAVYGGQHVRDVHAVTKDGRIVYQGDTLYSVEGEAVSFAYVSSIGGIGRGTATLTPGDWRFAMTMRATPTAAPQPAEIRWRWNDAESYTVSGGPAPVDYRRMKNK